MSLVEEFFGEALREETITEARETRIARYEMAMSSLLDPMSAPWPSDGFLNMAQRVSAVANMTVAERVECMFKTRDTPLDHLWGSDRQRWIEGLGQIGG